MPTLRLDQRKQDSKVSRLQHVLRNDRPGNANLPIGSFPRFQSARSVGSATWLLSKHLPWSLVSIRALRGERDKNKKNPKKEKKVSIRALRGERDPSSLPTPEDEQGFQSARSVGSATVEKAIEHDPVIVSIRALRGERDSLPAPAAPTSSRFNPRAPWGARRDHIDEVQFADLVSIRALRGERDFFRIVGFWRYGAFQSARSVGSATFF